MWFLLCQQRRHKRPSHPLPHDQHTINYWTSSDPSSFESWLRIARSVTIRWHRFFHKSVVCSKLWQLQMLKVSVYCFNLASGSYWLTNCSVAQGLQCCADPRHHARAGSLREEAEGVDSGLGVGWEREQAPEEESQSIREAYWERRSLLGFADNIHEHPCRHYTHKQPLGWLYWDLPRNCEHDTSWTHECPAKMKTGCCSAACEMLEERIRCFRYRLEVKRIGAN